MQNTKKLGIGICGLALSTLFLVNAKPVYADAITWDSDVSKTDVKQSNDTNADSSVNMYSSIKTAARVNNQGIKISKFDSAVANHQVKITTDKSSVHVNYVDQNGRSISNLKGYDINLTKTGNGQYNVPQGYQLPNANNQYNVQDTSTEHAGLKDGEKFETMHEGWEDVGSSSEIKPLSANEINVLKKCGVRDGDKLVFMKEYNDYIPATPIGATPDPDAPKYYDLRLYKLYFYDAHEDSDGSFYDPHTEFSISLAERELNTHRWDAHGLNNDDQAALNSLVSKIHTDDPRRDGGADMAYTEVTLGKPSYTFTDNSGNSKQSGPNSVNVTLVKPVNVDDAKEINRSVSRTITVNLPHIKPAWYQQHLNKNDQIVDTLTFRRKLVKDGLTGQEIKDMSTSWTAVGDDSFPSHTLPRIPGYQLVINK